MYGPGCITRFHFVTVASGNEVDQPTVIAVAFNAFAGPEPLPVSFFTQAEGAKLKCRRELVETLRARAAVAALVSYLLPANGNSFYYQVHAKARGALALLSRCLLDIMGHVVPKHGWPHSKIPPWPWIHNV